MLFIFHIVCLVVYCLFCKTVAMVLALVWLPLAVAMALKLMALLTSLLLLHVLTVKRGSVQC